jgi:branched-chain amino acid transport system ATP-binding protein
MDFGEIIAVGDPATIVRHPRVVEAYMGKAELGLPGNAPNAGAGDGTA